jgi:hypothetical protein
MAASYTPEFMIDLSGVYHEHHTHFTTQVEAEAFCADLEYRATAIRAIRVAASDDPPTHRWADGRLIELEEALPEPKSGCVKVTAVAGWLSTGRGSAR